MKNLIGVFLLTACFLFPPTISAATYYIAPDKNLDGTTYNKSTSTEDGTLANPFKTFTRAWQSLYPGDILILMDGIYNQQISPTVRAGTSTSPITVKAQNDGKAIVDGEYKLRPVELGFGVPNPLHFVFEGMNFRNGTDRTVQIGRSSVTFKRIHAYNQFYKWSDISANLPIEPQHPIMISGSINNPTTDVLLEDCIASGVGTKMIKIMRASATVRRCITDWRWHGGHTDANLWPWSGGLNIYHAFNGIFENIVAVGFAPQYGMNTHGLERDKDPNDPLQDNVANNKYVGSIAINSGRALDGSIVPWKEITYRPQPPGNPNPQFVWDYNWANQRGGFNIGGNIKDTLLKDILAYGNVGLGFIRSVSGTNYSTNTRLENATVAGNGAEASARQDMDPSYPTGQIDTSDWGNDMSVSNTYVQGDARYQGVGADITKKYINGVKTSENLWPWPIEQRVRDELGYSITNTVAKVTEDLNSKGHLPYKIARVSTAGFPVMSSSHLITFGANSPSNQSVTFRNAGDATLVLGTMRLVDDFNEGAFQLSENCPSSLSPGQSCTITVQHTATARAFQRGRIAIYGNMGQSNHPHIIELIADSSNPTPTPDPSQITPTHTPTPSGPTPTPDPNVLISQLSVVTGKAYTAVQNGLNTNVLQYIDRTVVFTSVPQALTGATFIQTSNNDKAATGDEFLSFYLSRPTMLYVAHDDRITTKPLWLSEFTDSGMNLVSGGGTFSLFSKSYSAGEVILGGNEGGTNSMYTVVAIPASVSITPTGTVKPGDADSDGDVDIFDYNAVLGNIGKTTGATRSEGDLDGDGDVDIFDYNEVIGNLGR